MYNANSSCDNAFLAAYNIVKDPTNLPLDMFAPLMKCVCPDFTATGNCTRCVASWSTPTYYFVYSKFYNACRAENMKDAAGFFLALGNPSRLNSTLDGLRKENGSGQIPNFGVSVMFGVLALFMI